MNVVNDTRHCRRVLQSSLLEKMKGTGLGLIMRQNRMYGLADAALNLADRLVFYLSFTKKNVKMIYNIVYFCLKNYTFAKHILCPPGI